MSESENSDIILNENEEVVKKKRKQIHHGKNKIHEEAKQKRVLGPAYTTNKGNVVAAKVQEVVLNCCSNRCFTKLSAANQADAFNNFYSGQSKSLQDAYLARCMERSLGPNKITLDPKKPRENIWSYFVCIGPLKVSVCRQLLLSLFKISVKKLRVIQGKILNNESFEEKRGSHVNRPRNISDDVISLMGEHLFHMMKAITARLNQICYILITAR